MHAATYTAFLDEMQKIASGISPTLVARPVLKSFHPGAHGFETLAKGISDTKVVRHAVHAAPNIAGKAMGAAKGMAQKLLPHKKALGLAGVGVAAGVAGDRKIQRDKQDQQGYAIPG